MLKDFVSPFWNAIPDGLRKYIPNAVTHRAKILLGVDSAPPATRSKAIPEAVASVRWHHRIDLGNGVITPGHDDSPAKLKAIRLPESLTGKTVLDIGAWDGFFSFEAERRGARRVLATDSFVWSGHVAGASKAGFELAKRLKRSRVEEQLIDVMDLSPEKIGTFDVVLFLGVLYHLKEPYAALERVASVTRDLLILETEAIFTRGRRPIFFFYPGYRDDPTNWWIPSPAGTEAMLRSVGFSNLTLVYSSVNAMRRKGRIVLHARR